MKRPFWQKLIVGIIACFVIAGCDESPPPATQGAAQKTSVAQTPVAAIGDEQVVEPEYVYDPAGTRDPFRNPLSAFVEEMSDSGVPLTPLQKVDLTQLRLIGAIVGKGEPRAMVIAPDNKSFVLKRGVKVGKNNGVVVEVTTDSVSVREEYLDYTGDVKSRIEEIKLPQQGGAK